MDKEAEWEYCIRCKNLTKHNDLFSKRNEVELDCFSDFVTIECCGCGNISFKTITTDWNNIINIEDSETESGFKPSPAIYVHCFPNALDGHEIIKNFIGVPNDVFIAYHQTIKALQGDSDLLASVGFRMIIEAICIDKKVKTGKLKPMINALADAGWVTKAERDRIHSIRYLGNSSAHEIKLPSKEQLLIVLDVVNHLLKNLYIIDAQMDNILDTVIKTEDKLLAVVKNKSFLINDSQERTLEETIGVYKDLLAYDFDLNKFEENLIRRIENDELKFIRFGRKIEDKNGLEKQTYILVRSKFPPFYNPDFYNNEDY